MAKNTSWGAWNLPQASENKTIELAVGDAIKRSLKLEASDIPGMALPGIVFPEIEGLARYPAQPEVTDRESRGDLTGNRTDSVTCICEKAGVYEMPSIVVPWWDVESEELNKIVLDGITVNVSAVEPKPSGNGVGESDSRSGSVASIPWWQHPLLWLALVAALFAGVCWYHWNTIARLLDERKQQLSENEHVRFANLEKASATNDPVAALNALMKWLDARSKSPETATIGQFVHEHDDPELIRQLDSLQLAAIGRSDSWSGRDLVKALQTAVTVKKRFGLDFFRARLPALNPSGTPV